jgi:hypothetical protein
MSSYVCNFSGTCETAWNGPHASLQECEGACSAVTNKDLLYETYSYNFKAVSELAPSDQVEIAFRVFGFRPSLDHVASIFMVLAGYLSGSWHDKDSAAGELREYRDKYPELNKYIDVKVSPLEQLFIELYGYIASAPLLRLPDKEILDLLEQALVHAAGRFSVTRGRKDAVYTILASLRSAFLPGYSQTIDTPRSRDIIKNHLNWISNEYGITGHEDNESNEDDSNEGSEEGNYIDDYDNEDPNDISSFL